MYAYETHHGVLCSLQKGRGPWLMHAIMISLPLYFSCPSMLGAGALADAGRAPKMKHATGAGWLGSSLGAPRIDLVVVSSLTSINGWTTLERKTFSQLPSRHNPQVISSVALAAPLCAGALCSTPTYGHITTRTFTARLRRQPDPSLATRSTHSTHRPS